MSNVAELPEYSTVSHIVKLLIAQAPISASTLGFVLADMRIQNPHLYVQYMLEKGIVHFGDQLKLTAGPLSRRQTLIGKSIGKVISNQRRNFC